MFAALALLVGFAPALAGPDRPSEFTNSGGIVNTRHNMTQRGLTGNDLLSGGPNSGGAGIMDSSRNNYGEICVYCHTPHGANTASAAPLWNKLLPAANSFTTYDQLGSNTMTQTVYNPGAGSLPCLSCHDGTQAVDSILNMPGSGRYNANPDNTFLNEWPGAPPSHDGLNNTGCLACHNPAAPGFANTAADFRVFAIGKDLRDDHPVGVTFPTTTGVGTDWKSPNGTKAVGALTTRFFDEDGDGRMDKEDIRMYDTGNGASVECASCHDPHGVAGNKTFLRKTNAGSAVCLTCHAK